MDIRYTQMDNLPPLAWLAEIKSGYTREKS